jgi:NAD(P)H-nitrite reductase large subunit
LIATGSHSHVPSIPNINIAGVFTFRNLKDAETLKSRNSATIIALGGGLLGLETARALQKQSTQAHLRADNLAGRNNNYTTSIVVTRLKVLDYPIFSMGQVAENETGISLKEHCYKNSANYVYRKLVWMSIA